ncbi:hypothetical protein [Winogradskyella sp.]|uniref:hypothetical protein n=1 Tax=Winogradskyella sp. TaxID=1883156 RepID=UPI0026243DD5|nr:hypothetical protein [Winogradskyella sp.]
MKPQAFIFFLLTCFIGQSQTAYEPFFNLKSGNAKEMNLKGDVTKVSWRKYFTDKLERLLQNGVIDYTFKNNLLQSKRIRLYNETHSYKYENGKRIERLIEVGGKLHSKYYIKHIGNEAQEYNSNTNKLTKTFSKNQNGQMTRLEEDFTPSISTRVFTVFSGLDLIKEETYTTYNKDGSGSIKYESQIVNTHKKGTWLNEPIVVETSVTKRNDKLLNENTITYYNTKGDQVYIETTYSSGKKFITETFYKYDLRGNWVSAITYNKDTGNVRLYQERKITYTDNLISGDVDFIESYINGTKYPEFPNQYAYKYDAAKKRFWIRDPSGNYLTKNDWLYFSNKSTNHRYYFDKTNGALVELTNYKLVKEGDLKFYPAKVISKNYEDFVFGIDDIKYIFTDGQFQNFSEGHIVKQSIDENKNSYYNTKTNKLYLFATDCKQITCKLELMPCSKDKAHYYLYKDKLGHIDCSPIGNGKLLDIKNYISIFGGTKSFMEYNGLYFEYDLTKTPVNTFHPAKAISKAEFDKVLANSKKLQGNIYTTAEGLAELIARYPESSTSKTPAKTKPSSQAAPTSPSTSIAKNNVDTYGCNNNLNCLNQLLQDRYAQLKAQGKTDKEAAKEQARIINQVYDYDKETAYQMVMNVNSNQLVNVLSELSPEQRAYFRSQSMDTIKSYEKKHGEVKIKTVPYKSKN